MGSPPGENLTTPLERGEFLFLPKFRCSNRDRRPTTLHNRRTSSRSLPYSCFPACYSTTALQWREDSSLRSHLLRHTIRLWPRASHVAETRQEGADMEPLAVVSLLEVFSFHPGRMTGSRVTNRPAHTAHLVEVETPTEETILKGTLQIWSRRRMNAGKEGG